MVYTKNTDGSFLVKGTRNDWVVSEKMTTCSCPKFKFMLRGQSPCHHMSEVIEGEKEGITPVDTGDFESWNPANYTEPLPEHKFIERFGSEQLDFLIKTFEVTLLYNMVRIL